MTGLQVMALLAGAALGAALLASDLRGQRLPDLLNAGLALAALAFHAARAAGVEWIELLLGALFGAGLFYAVRAVFFRLRRVEALGLGDVKFMAAAGLWVGIGGVAPLILIAATATLVVVLVRHGRTVSEEAVRRRRIPFGPGLVLGLAAVVAGQLLGVAGL